MNLCEAWLKMRSGGEWALSTDPNPEGHVYRRCGNILQRRCCAGGPWRDLEGAVFDFLLEGDWRPAPAKPFVLREPVTIRKHMGSDQYDLSGLSFNKRGLQVLLGESEADRLIGMAK